MNTTPTLRPRGRLFLFLGLGLAVLGIAAYVGQLWLQYLVVPWYMPALAWIGAALVAVSVWERRTIARVVALAFVLLLGGFELLALNAMRLPAYTGPVLVGRPFPAFEARLADGSPFTQASLIGGPHTALVFFRGRW
jgi:hypothetical protein